VRGVGDERQRAVTKPAIASATRKSALSASENVSAVRASVTYVLVGMVVVVGHTLEILFK
jgi:hypothetical protein